MNNRQCAENFRAKGAALKGPERGSGEPAEQHEELRLVAELHAGVEEGHKTNVRSA